MHLRSETGSENSSETDKVTQILHKYYNIMHNNLKREILQFAKSDSCTLQKRNKKKKKE